MTQEFASTNSSMDSNFSELNATLTGVITSNGNTIRADISDVNSSLTDLINTAVVDDLSTQISDALADITQQITDLNISIQAKVEETGQTITTNVNDVNTSLSGLMSSVKNQIQTDLSDHDTTMSSRLSDLNISVQGKMTATGNQLSTQLSDVNTSLSSMLNDIVVGDLGDQMDQVLSQITTQISGVRSDTNWLVVNAMNQSDMTEITSRFDSVDAELSLLENFCNNPDTNASGLCQEIYGIRAAIDIMDAEQETKLNKIDATTTDTWLLLSGDISTNIDTLLEDVGVIREQTTDINSTTHNILDELQGEVRVSVVS